MDGKVIVGGLVWGGVIGILLILWNLFVPKSIKGGS